ncbi:MAG: endopeptidase La [Geminicoccaceae bacterium]
MADELNLTEPGEPRTLPADIMPLVPVRNLVLFPGTVVPVTMARPRSIAAAQAGVRAERPIGVVLQREAGVEDPTGLDLHRIGTTANVLRYVTAPDGNHHLICQGQQRFKVLEFVGGYPFLAARIELIDEPEGRDTEIEARFMLLRERGLEAVELLPQAPRELADTIRGIGSAAQLADMMASTMDIEPAEKQEVLETVDLVRRLDRVLEFLNQRLSVLRLSRELGEATRGTLEKRQREHLLREQLATIRKELGEDEGTEAEVEDLKKAIAEAGMPEEVLQQANKELRRLERMPEAAAEHGMLRGYLDTLIELPWSKETEDRIDVVEAQRVLDEDHYNLAKIKKRIIEYLAVRKLAPEGRSPILCFVGPPGVGKTSLGQSIARAMGRKFARVSLGGVHDESEIRGHRRTYVGALPGNIIQAIRKVGVRNPVMMLDEMDKLGTGFHGDPSAALLEVLDPEQNSTFRDAYLAVPFDLSHVLFIGTANMLDTIPGPLRDRMEVIELPSYTEDEKVGIARRYLVARQLKATGLTPEQVEVTDDALHHLVRDYTREAGVRNLERTVGAVLRSAAVRVAAGHEEKIVIDAADLEAILGGRRFESEIAERTSVSGVATGLAWTPVGGGILFIEATRIPGKGSLILTGQLGDVMRESATAALSLVKSRAADLGIDEKLFERSDIHVHVPAGAIPKDGPSAGVAMFTALASLMTNRKVRADVAMTGEISLRGLVLPVGGIKEKVVAAHAAGIKRVLLPARNRRDYEEIPEGARQGLEFVWCERVDDALAGALEECTPAQAPAAA